VRVVGIDATVDETAVVCPTCALTLDRALR